jgi:TolB-like protein/DNA-binding winged helix-turn-helix (wHTH) protein
MELLILLLERDGQVVSRQEIVERLWGKNVFVDTEHGINTAIRKIRNALREDVEHPRFIQTLSGKGYRFVPETLNTNSNGTAPAPEKLSPPREGLNPPNTEAIPIKTSKRLRSSWVWGAIGLLLLAGAMVAFKVSGLRARLFAKNSIRPIHSIAVLPLANLSGDLTQEYFADGMTDELITALAQNRSLRVVSRTSAMQYKGVNKSLPDIAQALGVDGVLEGSVNRSGNHVHVTLQLIYAPGDTHVWAESYDRDPNGALALPASSRRSSQAKRRLVLLPADRSAISVRKRTTPTCTDGMSGSATAMITSKARSTLRRPFSCNLTTLPPGPSLLTAMQRVQ